MDGHKTFFQMLVGLFGCADICVKSQLRHISDAYSCHAQCVMGTAMDGSDASCCSDYCMCGIDLCHQFGS